MAYSRPSEVITLTMTFLEMGICSFQSIGIGKRTTRKSIGMLTEPIPKKMSFVSRHVPGTAGSQILLTGLQSTKLSTTVAMLYRAMTVMSM